MAGPDTRTPEQKAKDKRKQERLDIQDAEDEIEEARLQKIEDDQKLATAKAKEVAAEKVPRLIQKNSPGKESNAYERVNPMKPHQNRS